VRHWLSGYRVCTQVLSRISPLAREPMDRSMARRQLPVEESIAWPLRVLTFRGGGMAERSIA
jgi:hypothetical protein